MARLFEVPDGTRVRIVSKFIRWREHGEEMKVEESLVWEGTTTRLYDVVGGKRRRLIVSHTIPLWSGTGTFQTDCECEIVSEPRPL